MNLNFRSFITLSVFFVFLGAFTTGILRFLDNTPIIATYHMTFSFTLVLAIYFHIANNWEKLFAYLKGQKKELLLASLFFTLLLMLAYIFHTFSIGSTVI
jgi:hypothetical protein